MLLWNGVKRVRRARDAEQGNAVSVSEKRGVGLAFSPPFPSSIHNVFPPCFFLFLPPSPLYPFSPSFFVAAEMG